MSISSDPRGLLNPSGEKVNKKLADDDEPLYEGCKKRSKFQAALALYNLKINNNICDAGYEKLLRFVKSAFPRGEKLVGSIDESKKVLEKRDSNEDGIDHE